MNVTTAHANASRDIEHLPEPPGWFQQAFDVDPELVNVNGGSIAMGHPLGATGAIIIGTLLDELERQDKETGLATLCIASGMGAATIIERV